MQPSPLTRSGRVQVDVGHFPCLARSGPHHELALISIYFAEYSFGSPNIKYSFWNVGSSKAKQSNRTYIVHAGNTCSMRCNETYHSMNSIYKKKNITLLFY